MRGEDGYLEADSRGKTGITPACAGKTGMRRRRHTGSTDHPRMRGEDLRYVAISGTKEGSPPHARGRLYDRALTGSATRITPACAGKTAPIASHVDGYRDHPRMRGEDIDGGVAFEMDYGSPPHARGRRVEDDFHAATCRITPACAGKTSNARGWRSRDRDHPRMRGEDACTTVARRCSAGSPPHARGRRGTGFSHIETLGITPACAGKTNLPQIPVASNSDHPRMRGEDDYETERPVGHKGSPPHARGRPAFHSTADISTRITPACAGKTKWWDKVKSLPADHPRMRGEDSCLIILLGLKTGSPPHARGRHVQSIRPLNLLRITPACAGKTHGI